MASKAALTGKRMNMFGMNPDDLVIIGLDTDHEEGEHPLWDERINLPLDESLIRNITVFGVIKPVIVRKNGKVPEVVDGRRRVRAAREALKRQRESGQVELVVPVIAQRGEDLSTFGVMVLANEFRVDDGMLGKARKLAHLLRMGASTADAAITFGVTEASIRNWTKLLDCDPQILEAVDNDQLPASAAADLAVLPREEQVKKLEELQAEAGPGNKVTTRQTQRVKRSATSKPGTKVHSAPRKPVLKALVEKSTTARVPDVLVAAVRWFLGESDGSDIAGLAEVLEVIEREQQVKALKITEAQQEIIDRLREAPVPASELNKKTIAAMAKRDLVEAVEGDDGVQHIQLKDTFVQLLAAVDDADAAVAKKDPVTPLEESAETAAPEETTDDTVQTSVDEEPTTTPLPPEPAPQAGAAA